jgi:hypothetical protein
MKTLKKTLKRIYFLPFLPLDIIIAIGMIIMLISQTGFTELMIAQRDESELRKSLKELYTKLGLFKLRNVVTALIWLTLITYIVKSCYLT